MFLNRIGRASLPPVQFFILHHLLKAIVLKAIVLSPILGSLAVPTDEDNLIGLIGIKGEPKVIAVEDPEASMYPGCPPSKGEIHHGKTGRKPHH